MSPPDLEIGDASASASAGEDAAPSAATEGAKLETRQETVARLRGELDEREKALATEERALRTTLVRAGYLTKQGHRVLSWKKRWFQLKGDELSYFRGPRSTKSKGVISLSDYLLEKAEHPHAGRTLRLCNTRIADRSEDYVIFAETAQDFVLWVKAIDKVKREAEAIQQKRAALESDRLDVEAAIGQADTMRRSAARRRSAAKPITM